VTHAPRSLRQRRDALTRIRAASFSILVAALAITVTASLLTWHLNNGLPRERHTQEQLGHTQVDAAQLHALESRLIAPGNVEARDTLASELILDDMATHARELADLRRAGDTVSAVRGLIAAFRQLAPALAVQNQSQAKLIYRTRYLPARTRLDDVMGPANRAAKQRLDLRSCPVDPGACLARQAGPSA
jgi:hypothetical protein